MSLKNLKDYEVDYDQGSHEYAYENGEVQINGHQCHLQTQPLPHTWNQQDHQFTQDYAHTSMGTENSTETNNFPTDEMYESKPYPRGANNPVEYNSEGGHRDNHIYGEHNNARNHFQVSGIFYLTCFIIADNHYIL